MCGCYGNESCSKITSNYLLICSEKINNCCLASGLCVAIKTVYNIHSWVHTGSLSYAEIDWNEGRSLCSHVFVIYVSIAQQLSFIQNRTWRQKPVQCRGSLCIATILYIVKLKSAKEEMIVLTRHALIASFKNQETLPVSTTPALPLYYLTLTLNPLLCLLAWSNKVKSGA